MDYTDCIKTVRRMEDGSLLSQYIGKHDICYTQLEYLPHKWTFAPSSSPGVYLYPSFAHALYYIKGNTLVNSNIVSLCLYSAESLSYPIYDGQYVLCSGVQLGDLLLEVPYETHLLGEYAEIGNYMRGIQHASALAERERNSLCQELQRLKSRKE